MTLHNNVAGISRESRIRGCLLGGAVGDALGAPLEFMRLREIRERFGPDGPAELEEAFGRRGAITDDTQMTLFTAEGLIRADNRFTDRGICHVPSVVHRAYLRWLLTQGESPPGPSEFAPESGWLMTVRDLWQRRAPGGSCLSALRSGNMGSVDRRINDSKGCGGVMRVAPVGLVDGIDSFGLGCEVAAITHGHPSGYLAAGVLARVIHDVAKGASLRDAIAAGRRELLGRDGHGECVAAIDHAVALAASGRGTPEEVESLGQGWVAEEALAIGLFAALVARDLEHGVRLAVNHGGDSDSTGSIAGQILGTMLGARAIPQRWLEPLELRDTITTIARDLADISHAPRSRRGAPVAPDRYPPW
jgi:ADP-ribosylglycohydrolase